MSQEPASSKAVIYIRSKRNGELGTDVITTTLNPQNLKMFQDGAAQTIKKAYGKKHVDKVIQQGVFAQAVGEYVLMLTRQQGQLGEDPELVRVAILDGPMAGSVCKRTDVEVPEDVRARNEPGISLEPVITSDDQIH